MSHYLVSEEYVIYDMIQSHRLNTTSIPTLIKKVYG
jgi:hypothetical protein